MLKSADDFGKSWRSRRPCPRRPAPVLQIRSSREARCVGGRPRPRPPPGPTYHHTCCRTRRDSRPRPGRTRRRIRLQTCCRHGRRPGERHRGYRGAPSPRRTRRLVYRGAPSPRRTRRLVGGGVSGCVTQIRRRCRFTKRPQRLAPRGALREAAPSAHQRKSSWDGDPMSPRLADLLTAKEKSASQRLRYRTFIF
jgi:hypothetical protein